MNGNRGHAVALLCPLAGPARGLIPPSRIPPGRGQPCPLLIQPSKRPLPIAAPAAQPHRDTALPLPSILGSQPPSLRAGDTGRAAGPRTHGDPPRVPPGHRSPPTRSHHTGPAAPSAAPAGGRGDGHGHGWHAKNTPKTSEKPKKTPRSGRGRPRCHGNKPCERRGGGGGGGRLMAAGGSSHRFLPFHFLLFFSLYNAEFFRLNFAPRKGAPLLPGPASGVFGEQPPPLRFPPGKYRLAPAGKEEAEPGTMGPCPPRGSRRDSGRERSGTPGQGMPGAGGHTQGHPRVRGAKAHPRK